MKRLILVISTILILSSCTKRYFIILDGNSSAHQNKEVILVDKKEKPKIRVVTLGVNFMPAFLFPVNQPCIPRPTWFYY